MQKTRENPLRTSSGAQLAGSPGGGGAGVQALDKKKGSVPSEPKH